MRICRDGQSGLCRFIKHQVKDMKKNFKSYTNFGVGSQFIVKHIVFNVSICYNF